MLTFQQFAAFTGQKERFGVVITRDISTAPRRKQGSSHSLEIGETFIVTSVIEGGRHAYDPTSIPVGMQAPETRS